MAVTRIVASAGDGYLAIDDETSAWVSGTGSPVHWLAVDLGEQRVVHEVQALWHREFRPLSYELQGSPDANADSAAPPRRGRRRRGGCGCAPSGRAPTAGRWTSTTPRRAPTAARIRSPTGSGAASMPARTAARWLRIKTTADAHFSPTDLTSPVVLGELLVCASAVSTEGRRSGRRTRCAA